MPDLVGRTKAADGEAPSHEPVATLFRKEARRNLGRLSEGEVRLARPLSWWFVCGFVTSALILCALVAALASAPRSERIAGTIQPSRGFITIPAPEQVQIVEVYARSGDVVARDQRLARLVTQDRLKADREEQDRSLALIAAQIAANRRQTAASALTHRAGSEDSLRQATELREMNTALEARVAEHRRLLDEERRGLADVAALAARGLITRTVLRARQLEVIAREETIAEFVERMRINSARAASHEVDAGRYETQRLEEAERLNQAQMSLLQQQHEIVGASDFIVRAPQSGRFIAIAAVPGDFAAAGEPLLQIEPEGGSLTAEFDLPMHLRGWVVAGRSIRLTVSALPPARFGYIEGTIVEVQGPRRASRPEDLATFRMRVDLADVPASLRPHLSAGMAVTANIEQDRQSLLARALAVLRGAG